MQNLLLKATYDPVLAFVLLLGLALFVAVVVRTIALVVKRAATKECAACKSRVPNGATKCRFCGSDLTDGNRGGPTADERAGM